MSRDPCDVSRQVVTLKFVCFVSFVSDPLPPELLCTSMRLGGGVSSSARPTLEAILESWGGKDGTAMAWSVKQQQHPDCEEQEVARRE